jgi:thiol-disulfide isomerase/thioredoxin
MIQEILKSLALENRRLIVPTIGAFLLDTQKQVKFSSFLKYDDGLLSKLLSERKNITEEQSKQIIQDFTHEILNAVNSGDRYKIPNFGYFTKDSKNNIDFVFEDINEKPIVNETEPVFAPYIPPVVETTPAFGNTGQEPQNNFDFSNIFIPPTNTADTAPQKTKEKKNNAGYWILTIILIIIAILLLTYLFSSNFKQTVNSLFSSKPKIEVKKDTATIVVDTVKVQQEDTVAIKQENTDTQTTSIPKSTPNGKYQARAATYNEKNVAESQANKLKNKGYDVQVIPAGDYYVIIYESGNEQDAVRIKDFFVAEGYNDAFVKTRPGGVSTTAATKTQEPVQSHSSVASTEGNTKGKYQTIAGCFIQEENGERLANELESNGFDVTIKYEGEWTILIICTSNDLNEANRVKEQCISAGYDAWVRTR